MPVPDLDPEKLLAAEAAVQRVRPGMRLALGTGSTAAFAVRALADRFPDGGKLHAVASSAATEWLARELGLSVGPLVPRTTFDLMIDGADEVAPTLDLTKGGGGALFREKYLARLAKEVVIVVDHTKLVTHLGTRAAIPIEVVPWARPTLVAQLEDRGFGSLVRTIAGTDQPFLTDNGNEIVDLRPSAPVPDPAALDRELHGFMGVVETGIFAGMTHRVFVGLPDLTVQEILPHHVAAAGA
ncbi:MAG: ribose-5-phosphate isomerase RpiA [Thermoplasmata archaeon]